MRQGFSYMPQHMARSRGGSVVHKVLAAACVVAVAGVLAIASIGVGSNFMQAQESTYISTCLERAGKHQGLQVQSCNINMDLLLGKSKVVSNITVK